MYSWTSEPNGCIIRCVANLADKKFYAFNEVSRMKFLGTVVHRLTELLPNHCQHRANLYHNDIFKYISLRHNEETKKLRKFIRNKLTRKQEQCAC
jgi:hypothetical protein